MLIFRIIATVLLSLSLMCAPIKNILIFKDTRKEVRNALIGTLWSLLWRAFVIVAIWII